MFKNIFSALVIASVAISLLAAGCTGCKRGSCGGCDRKVTARK